MKKLTKEQVRPIIDHIADQLPGWKAMLISDGGCMPGCKLGQPKWPKPSQMQPSNYSTLFSLKKKVVLIAINRPNRSLQVD